MPDQPKPSPRYLDPSNLPLETQATYQIYERYLTTIASTDQVTYQALLNYQDLLVAYALIEHLKQQVTLSYTRNRALMHALRQVGESHQRPTPHWRTPMNTAKPPLKSLKDLTPESQVEYYDFATYLRKHRDEALALALEAKLQFLLVRQDHGTLQTAIQDSGLDWLDRSRLLQGDTADPAAVAEYILAHAGGVLVLESQAIGRPLVMVTSPNIAPGKLDTDRPTDELRPDVSGLVIAVSCSADAAQRLLDQFQAFCQSESTNPEAQP
jgi:hypothetical protein